MKIAQSLVRVLLPAAIVLLAISLSSCKKSGGKVPRKVTVSELKDIVLSDSNNYRMVYVYDPLCNSCGEQMQQYAANYLKGKNKDVHHYMVSVQPNRWRFHSDTLMMFVLDKDIELFAIADTTAKYTKAEETHVMNIIADLIQDTTVSLHDGTPQSFFLSDNNKLLKATFAIDGERIVMPCEVGDVAECIIRNLDFEKMVEL
ncbi:MAG: hypothetical protein IJU35_06540 [Paludibacteraceae bacterium]|nr:hypothetical protein [Paludibacteraceae bacterium]